ncbi:hypothetical protein CKM354_000408900 [Cercospora kikuchii]|uniref:UmuC domain-containing protein n=1 Tax=Cercospora kikuchii TaxID=84275 RepID=A0A9P3CG59_9PEZI|nr:uncharacterized protein CKM354_000408900 [Cercospora kikuchii]GIZ40762.1 hypothetical protein CKM354_000408900 [Cercospora kikuchii]
MGTRMVPLPRDRVILHFDYDCFYASVFESEDPSLRSLPFAVQQKQICVTANYVARSRGIYKLQLVKDAKRMCPDLIIKLGEDISKFRDASKELYSFIKSFSWNDKVERLGFDEVWLDVSDIVEYNQDILNKYDLEHSFFQTSKDDPTIGFSFDATKIAGHSYPKDYASASIEPDELTLRLRLGSHLALHIRHELESQKGYTSTVGISTSKLLSKLVGNLNKPKGQTTLMPPYWSQDGETGNVKTFIDNHDIGKIPGIGFKLSQKLREFCLQRPAAIDEGLVYGGTKERVTVADVRKNPDTNPEMLEKLLSGPGSAHGIGQKIYDLLHGRDETEVSSARAVPRQISIEDSYIRLDTMPELLKELDALARSLLNRMRIDLLASDDDFDDTEKDEERITDQQPAKPISTTGKRWLAHPKTLRLTTRPRMPLQPDGTRVRSFKRISHSAPLPNFVFGLNESVDALAEKLVKETLMNMFRKLHPEKAGWNLSLVNLAVTNMAETAGNSKTANGRDIGGMFKRQDEVLKDFRVTEFSASPSKPGISIHQEYMVKEEEKDASLPTENYVFKNGRKSDEARQTLFDDDDDDDEEAGWVEDERDKMDELCGECGIRLPTFAMGAHLRFHQQATISS